MNRKEKEEAKALFESMVLDGLTGGFNFGIDQADELNKITGKIFKYIKLLEEENKLLSEHCSKLERPIIDQALKKSK
jgi:hypothetical protein